MNEQTWEQAYIANKRRTSEAQEHIDAARAEPADAELEARRDAEADRLARPRTRAGQFDALAEVFRAEPTSAEIEAEMADAQADRRRCTLCGASGVAGTPHKCDLSVFNGIDPSPPDTLTLSGAKLAAYRQLEAAAGAAHAAQESMAATGAALRDAIQAMCAAMTGKQ